MAGRLHSVALAATAQLARFLGAAALFILLARLWPPAQFGSFAFHYALAMALGAAAGFGLPVHLMRQISLDPAAARRHVADSCAAQLALAAGCAALGGGLVLLGVVTDWLLFALLLAAALASQVAEAIYGALRGLGRHAAEVRVATTGNSLAFLLPCAAAVGWQSVHAAALALAAARIAQLAMSLWLARRALDGPAGPGRVGATLSAALPYAAESILGSLLLQADTILVGATLGAAAAGLYQAGLGVVLAALLFAQALANVFTPLLTAGIADGRRVRALYRPILWAFALYGLASLVGLGLMGEAIVTGLYGPDYAPLGPLMPLFGLVILARCIAAPPGILLTAVGEQGTRAALAAAAAALYLALAVPAALRFGVAGAALANAAAMAFLAIGYRLRVRARLGERTPA